MTAQTYRYQLPKKAFKSDCPDCGPKHRRTLSRYVDSQTGEPLPEPYGRCDRESNCSYHLSPYHKSASGLSYADEVYQQWKEDSPMPARANQPKRVSSPPSAPALVYSIPDEVFNQSLGHYDKNQFARLLLQQFGHRKAIELLQRFHIGTSARWPGACVFWYIDEQNRKRGGQIKLFGSDWHTEKYVDRDGRKRAKVDWVHSALKYRTEKAGTPLPDWLIEYNDKGERSSCLFGLPQLRTEIADKPIAIVEAPKTAIVCTVYLPDFIWLAVGSLSYLTLNTDVGRARLAPVRGRKVMLFPDLNAFADWSKRAEQLRANGFVVEVSDYLETHASEEQKQAGLDLADYLLRQPPTVSTIAEQIASPGAILKPDESQIERLMVEPCSNYPASWDKLNETD